MNNKSYFGFLVVGALVLSGCAGPSPSITPEDAKNLAANFETLQYTPPPKKAVGVIDILDNTKPVDRMAFSVARSYISNFDPFAFPMKEIIPTAMSCDEGWYKNLVQKAEAFELFGRWREAARTFDLAYVECPRARGNFARRLYGGTLFAWLILGNLEVAEKYQKLKESIAVNDFEYGADRATAAIIKLLRGDLLGAKKDLETGSFDQGNYVKALAQMATAEVQAASGQYSEAQVSLLSAIDEFNKTYWGAFGFIPYIQSRWAEYKMSQGKPVEAEVIGRGALVTLVENQGNKAILTGMTLSTLARSYSEQGRLEDAAAVAARAEDILAGANRLTDQSFLMVRLNSAMSSIALLREEWVESAYRYEKVQPNVEGNRWPSFEETAEAFLNGAVAYLHMGEATRADWPLQQLEQIFVEVSGPDSYKTLEVQALQAASKARQGQVASARSVLKAVLPRLFQKMGNIVGGKGFNVKKKRLELIAEVAAELAANGGDADPEFVGLAFAVADMINASSVSNAMSKSRLRDLTAAQEAENPIRRIQDAENKIAALTNALANQYGDPTYHDEKVARWLYQRITDLGAERDAIQARLEKEDPGFKKFLKPKLTSPADVAAQLSTDEVLIQTLLGHQASFVWVVTPSGKVRISRVGRTRKGLEAVVAKLRGALDLQSAEYLGDIPQFDVAAAHDLYRDLLQPLEADWQGAKTIVFVADGVLASLPLSVLPVAPGRADHNKEPMFSDYRQVKWLIRTHNIMNVPSAGSLIAARSSGRGTQAVRAYFGVGDPLFNEQQLAEVQAAEGVEQAAAQAPAAPIQVASISRGITLRSQPGLGDLDSATIEMLPRLPDTRTEVEEAARAFSKSQGIEANLLVGLEASESNVKAADLRQTRILHFATHGLVGGDINGLNEPALALSSPRLTNEVGQDGLLTMGEIMALNLNADWAVLSACNTASSLGRDGDSYSGLGSAFFYAGAKALLLSNWPVYSDATTRLMTKLFSVQAEQSSLSGVAAHRQAMLSLIDDQVETDDQGRIEFSYAHPIFWAPFVIVGDAR